MKKALYHTCVVCMTSKQQGSISIMVLGIHDDAILIQKQLDNLKVLFAGSVQKSFSFLMGDIDIASRSLQKSFDRVNIAILNCFREGLMRKGKKKK